MSRWEMKVARKPSLADAFGVTDGESTRDFSR
jgi:hypothetical protein